MFSRSFRFLPLPFQSTLPVRGATYIHPKGRYFTVISIHAPREGSDNAEVLEQVQRTEFQSTLPVRGATRTSLGEKAE